MNFLNRETDAKRMGLLHDLVPQTTLIAVLRNPTGEMPLTNCKICRKRYARLEKRFLFSTRVPMAKSKPVLLRLSSSGPMRLSS